MGEDFGIKHFEDLDSDSQNWLVNNINRTIVTEKVDGQNIMIGIDKFGELFVSRENKGGQRFYTLKQIPHRFSNNAIRSAFPVIISNKHIFEQFLKPTQTIQAELLFGKKPNLIEYDGRNRIILLPTRGVNFERVSEVCSESSNMQSTCLLVKSLGYGSFETVPSTNSWSLTSAPKLNNLIKPIIKQFKDRIITDGFGSVKPSILEMLNVVSSFGQNTIEGVVISTQTISAKIVDREEFSRKNQDLHKSDNYFSQNCWLSTWRVFNRYHADNEYGYAGNLLREFLQERSHEWRQQTGHFHQLHNNVSVDTFNQIHLRVLDLLKQTRFPFESCSEITYQNIDPTIRHICSKLKLDPGFLSRKDLVGSGGKKSFSGDLDIFVHTDRKQELLQAIEAHLHPSRVKHSPGLDIVHTVFDIANDPRMGTVQVDFIFGDDADWTKFNYFSAGHDSDYSGAHRTRLLSALVAATNRTIIKNGILLKRTGYVWVPKQGLVWQERFRTKKKDGTLTKAFKIKRDSSKPIMSKPEDVCTFLFGTHTVLDHLSSYENIRKLMSEHFSQQYINKVLNIFVQGLKNSRLSIPEGIQT